MGIYNLPHINKLFWKMIIYLPECVNSTKVLYFLQPGDKQHKTKNQPSPTYCVRFHYINKIFKILNS